MPLSAAGALSAQCADATVAAIEPSTATPSAPPTCREALTTPEAMPARVGSTEPIATPVVVGIDIDTPAPTKMNDGKITVQYDESIESRVSDAESGRHDEHAADDQRPRPDAPGQLAGDRRDQHHHHVIGSVRTPDSSAE